MKRTPTIRSHQLICVHEVARHECSAPKRHHDAVLRLCRELPDHLGKAAMGARCAFEQAEEHLLFLDRLLEAEGGGEAAHVGIEFRTKQRRQRHIDQSCSSGSLLDCKYNQRSRASMHCGNGRLGSRGFLIRGSCCCCY